MKAGEAGFQRARLKRALFIEGAPWRACLLKAR